MVRVTRTTRTPSEEASGCLLSETVSEIDRALAVDYMHDIHDGKVNLASNVLSVPSVLLVLDSSYSSSSLV